MLTELIATFCVIGILLAILIVDSSKNHSNKSTNFIDISHDERIAKAISVFNSCETDEQSVNALKFLDDVSRISIRECK